MESIGILQLPIRQARRELYAQELGELETDLNRVSELADAYAGNEGDRAAARSLIQGIMQKPYGLNSLMAMYSRKSRAPLTTVMPFSGMGTPPTVAQGLVDSYKELMRRGEDPYELPELKQSVVGVLGQEAGVDGLMYGLRPE